MQGFLERRLLAISFSLFYLEGVLLILSRGCQEQKPVSTILNMEVLLFSFYIYGCKTVKKLQTKKSALYSIYAHKKNLMLSPIFKDAYRKVGTKYGLNVKLHDKLLEMPE